MYCKHCGSFVDGNLPYCKNCGAQIEDKHIDYGYSDDKSSFWFAFLGFVIPVVGLILFLIYEDKKPKRAKSAGKGALTGFIIRVVLSIILVILYFVLVASVFGGI